MKQTLRREKSNLVMLSPRFPVGVLFLVIIGVIYFCVAFAGKGFLSWEFYLGLTVVCLTYIPLYEFCYMDEMIDWNEIAPRIKEPDSPEKQEFFKDAQRKMKIRLGWLAVFVMGLLDAFGVLSLWLS